ASPTPAGARARRAASRAPPRTRCASSSCPCPCLLASHRSGIVGAATDPNPPFTWVLAPRHWNVIMPGMNHTTPKALMALIGLGCIIFAGAACEKAKDKAAKAPPPPPPAVVVAEVQQRTVPIIRDFTARTEGIPTVDVRARVSGVLDQVLYNEGTE